MVNRPPLTPESFLSGPEFATLESMRTTMYRLLAILLSISCSAPIPELSSDAPRVLVFTRTTEYRHENIQAGIEAIETAGKRRGIAIDTSEDPTVFSKDALAPYRAVVFFNTTGDVLDRTQQVAFERYIQAGGGFIGIHAAADTEWKKNAWPWYTRLVGAAFLSHPNEPSNVQEATVRLVNPNHPSTATMPQSWEHRDEWYDYQRFSKDVEVLLRVDEDTYQGGQTGDFHPISWKRDYDGGRSFYTGLGHTEESFSESLYLDHLFGGIRWAMGSGDGPPALDYQQSSPEPWRILQETVVESIGEPIALEFNPAGELYIIERRGRIRHLDPKTGNVQLAGELEVYSFAENGLMGIVFAPDFQKTAHGYLYYATDADGRHRYRLSRFEFREEKILPETEKILLEVGIDPGDTGHEGGDMQFDDQGNLWLSTGDDSYPQAIDGYAPMNESLSTQNALGTSANSQDLRGKILRIHPEADGSYTIPDGNLFSDPANGRPEIYVMGLRNPFRFSFDDRTQTLYWGEIGPDANEDHPERGPRGYDEFNRTRKPGFFGWPLFIQNNLPYRPWDMTKGAATGPFFDPENPRNDSPANDGLRELPPPQPAWIAYPYALDDQFFELGGGDVTGVSRRAGRSAMSGPVYYTDRYPAETRFPKYYDGKLILYDFMRDSVWLAETDDQENLIKIEPLAELDLNSPIDLTIAPDGSIWILEYGSNWFTDNKDSRISRLSYFTKSNPPPVAVADIFPLNSAAPSTLRLDGSQSWDRNPDDTMQWEWSITDASGQTSIIGNQEIAEHNILQPGVYTVSLMVTDDDGSTSTDSTAVQVGNAPPRVTIRLDGNRSFFAAEPLAYSVLVEDAEDGSSQAGSIAAEDVLIQFDFSPEGFSAGAPTNTHGNTLAINHEVEGCGSCHAEGISSAGPSLRAIADRYAEDPNAGESLAARVRSGGSGHWSDRAMPAHDHLTPDRARELVDQILNLSPNRPPKAGLPLTGELLFEKHAETLKPNQWMGPSTPAQYRLRASYQDHGSEGIGPLPAEAEVVFSHPNRRAALFNATEGTMTVLAPESSLVPEDLAGEPLVIATTPGGYVSFTDLDLSEIVRVDIVATALSAFMEGGRIDVHLESLDGPIINSVDVESRLLPSEQKFSVQLDQVHGVFNLFFVFQPLEEDQESNGAMLALLSINFATEE